MSFDESLHPRGEGGKFGEGSGTPKQAKPRKTGTLFQNQPKATKPKTTTAAAKPKTEVAAKPVTKPTEPAKVEKPATQEKSKPTKSPKQPKDPHEQLAKLKPADPKTTSDLIEGSKQSAEDTHEFEVQRARSLKVMSPKETASLKTYVNPDSTDYSNIRQAEMTKAKGEFGDHAKTIKAALNREIANSQPVQLYRGMSVSPEVAGKLMSGRSLDLKATSSFSPKSGEAVDFSTGFGESKAGNIPVVISGRLRGVALAHSPEIESLIPAKKLKITGKSVVNHPVHGRILVLHVAD